MKFSPVILSLMLLATTLTAQSISADFPFTSQYQKVGEDRIHYVETGEGDPVLFLHGVPMSAYSWRNILPHVSPHARCIALDFMGFGQSDKPDIDYSFSDQLRYLEGFINAMELKNITLVMTDIGGIIGTRYAMDHPENVRGLVFMETPIADARTFHKNGGMMQRMMFWMGRQPKMGYNKIVKKNIFLKMMPMLIKRKLTETEKNTYWAPFPTPESRIPLYVLPHSFPKKGKNTQPGDMGDFLNRNAADLQASSLPKLLLYAKPGMLINKKNRNWAIENLSQLEMEFVGKAKHLMEEDVPHEIGEAIQQWYVKLGKPVAESQK